MVTAIATERGALEDQQTLTQDKKVLWDAAKVPYDNSKTDEQPNGD